MLSEEKKAIDNLFHLQHINTYLDLHKKETFKIKNRTIIKWSQSVETLLNFITRLKKENEDLQREKEENKFIIGMANNEMLGYNQGYLDGKSQNSSATEIIIQNRQNYIHKQEAELLQKKIEKYKYLYQKALDNTVKSDKENMDLKKQIDLMGEVIFKKFAAQLVLEYGIENKEQFIKLFEEKAKEKGE